MCILASTLLHALQMPWQLVILRIPREKVLAELVDLRSRESSARLRTLYL